MDSKDGSKSFSVNGLFYHSSYSPEKEALRFAQSQQFLFNPKIIFFIEPGFNYAGKFLKNRIPDCKIVCIRFFDKIFEDENTWDQIIRYDKKDDLSQYLINHFGEEALLSSTLVIWPVANKIFAEEINLFIKAYKESLEYSKTLLITRQFFEKKWLINSCNFIKYGNNFINPDIKTRLPLLLCASGPSINKCLSIIKKYQNKLFILCLSSALSLLIKNSIKPDIILSTDGGFWAGEHLKYLKKNPGLPLAAPCEAFIPKQILKNNPLLALCYNDESSFICSQIFKEAELPFFQALRNPTVSGTGLYFAKSLTSNNIYFCGLDLAGNPGFQHAQPNENEKDNELFDSRIKSRENRISRSRYNSDSLKIYRNWFATLDEKEVSKLYRVIDSEKQKSLGNIQNISSLDFENKLSELKDLKDKVTFEGLERKNNSVKKTLDFIIKEVRSEKWSRQIFPADYLAIQKAMNEEEKNLLTKRLDKKIEELINKIRVIADE